MKTQLFLLAFIVSNGLTPVRSKNEISTNVWEIQKHFHNFFESIRKSDMKKTETYRNFLEHETARDQQAFDTMKEEFRHRRQRNSDKQRNFNYKSTDIAEKAVVFKRGAGPDIDPTDQPGCARTDHTKVFFRTHEKRRNDSRDNWVCEESFQNKLKICVIMLKTLMKRAVESNYEIIHDKESVQPDCEEQAVTFFEPMENETDLFDMTENTIGVWMFQCPVTKMHLKFSEDEATSAARSVKDFYITKGKDDERPIIAVLQKSQYTSTICLKGMWRFNREKMFNDTQS